MERKNIAILINSLAAGGAERVISRISKPLSKFYNVYIMLLDVENIKYNCTGKICNVGGGYKNYYRKVIHSIGYINKLVKEEKIECIISFLDVPNLINVLGIRGCKRIINLRCFYSEEICSGLAGRIKLGMCRCFFRKADGVVLVAKALEEYSIRYLRLNEEKVWVIENAYDVDEIIEKANESIEKEEEDFIYTHKTALAMGRLNEQKGYQFLLKCFAKVCESEPEAGLVILGGGVLDSELKTLAAELKIEKSVLFLGIKKNPFSYISKSMIYVSASLYEGFPNALVEAMACGVPVIQTDCLTGPREILTEVYVEKCVTEVEYADYGILVPDFNRIQTLGLELERAIAIYADVWIKLLQDTELQKEYGIKARERARHYSMEDCIAKYCEAIEAVINSK